MRPAGVLLTVLAPLLATALQAQDASPSIRILDPPPADLLEGRVTLQALVQAPPGVTVDGVSFRVDGRQLGDVTAPPYEIVWDEIDTLRDHLIRCTARFSDGTRAYDLRSIPVLGMVTRATVLAGAPDRVLLGVTFLDRRGEPVTDVRLEEVRVREDGNPQSVDLFEPDNRPLSVQLLLDASHSTEPYWSALSRSTRLFAETLRADDRAGVEAFNDKSFELAPLGSPASEIETATSRFRHWGGATFLYDVLSRAALLTVGQEQQGRRALVLLTDAEDFGSSLTMEDAAEYLGRTDVQVHAVVWLPDKKTVEAMRDRGTDLNRIQRDMEQLVRDTGGEQMNYADHPLEETFLRIGERLRAQYLLSYTSLSAKPAGEEREIEIRLQRSGGQRVRYRSVHYGGQGLGVFLAGHMREGPEARRMMAMQSAVRYPETQVIQGFVENLSEGESVLTGLALKARLTLLHYGVISIPYLRDALSESEGDTATRVAQVLADLFVVLDRLGNREALDEGLLLLGRGDDRKGRQALQALLEQDLIPETRAGLDELLSTLAQETG